MDSRFSSVNPIKLVVPYSPNRARLWYHYYIRFLRQDSMRWNIPPILPRCLPAFIGTSGPVGKVTGWMLVRLAVRHVLSIGPGREPVDEDSAVSNSTTSLPSGRVTSLTR